MIVLTLIATTLGCGSDTASGPSTQSPESVFSQLVFNHRAVTLAMTPPYDTIRLMATPQQGNGSTVPGTYEVRYRSFDSTQVKIDSLTGAAVATGISSGVPIVATLRIGNVTRTDTAIVAVTNDVAPSRLATFSIQPFSGDSAKIAIGAGGQQASRSLDLTMIDSAGNPQLYPVYYSSADVGVIALVDARNGVVGSVYGLGSTWVYATTTVYGVTHTDSLKFAITRPLDGEIDFRKANDGSYFVNPGLDTLAVGAGFVDFATGQAHTVIFANVTGTAMDLVFDDSLAVLPSPLAPFYTPDDTATVGNIRTWSADPTNPFSAARLRYFPTAGIYRYHSTVLPSIHGTIVIAP